MTEEEIQERLPVIPHRATGVDCIGCVVINVRGKDAELLCNECGASLGVLNVAVLEALVAHNPVGLFREGQAEKALVSSPPMPLFRLTENRYINTDHVDDIRFTPSGERPFRIGSVLEDEPPMVDTTIAHDAGLRIDLKNENEIELRGEEAEKAWAAFKAAMHPMSDLFG